MRLADKVLRLGLLAFGMTGATSIVVACSSRDTGFAPSGPALVDQDAGAQEPEPPKCGLHCSRDLKQVLNGCEGEEVVVEQCSADQGCGNGRCVDACAAAALNKGSTGCEFWTLPPTDSIEFPGSCFAAMVANTWDRPVSISAKYGDAALDISKSIFTVSRQNEDPIYTLLEGTLPPGEVAVVFLAHNETDTSKDRTYCPPTVTPAMLVDPIIHGTAKTKAFQIKADAPVSAYSIYPYGGADTHMPTATLLLPVSSWEQNYIAVSPFHFGQPLKRRTLQIVANEDDTEVRIRPTVEVRAAGDVAGATAGVTQTWKLSKGQVLQFVQPALTGSPIETTKPVGLFGGSECTFLPSASNWCDVLQQQIPAVAQWGTEYAVVPFQSRIHSLAPSTRERVPYTIVAAADDTTFTYEPSRPRDAPETLKAGESANFITDEFFVVRSQDAKHPFHVNVYMTGSGYGGGTGTTTTGDPDFVNVPAADQYLDRYVFFTDFTFPDTRLTVVRRKTAQGFKPVELECAGPIEGFQPLGTSGEYEYAFVRLTEAFLPQKFAKGECSYGRQEARSDGPFAVTVWGMGLDASYGYVGGTGLRTINDATPPSVR